MEKISECLQVYKDFKEDGNEDFKIYLERKNPLLIQPLKLSSLTPFVSLTR